MSDPSLDLAVYVGGETTESKTVALSELTRPGSPKLELITPAGGEQWTVDSTYTINWSHEGEVAQVDLAFTIGNDVWLPIISNIPNTGSFLWKIPDVPSIEVKVRVSASDGIVSDESDAFFSIAAQSVSILTQQAGNCEFKLGGETESIDILDCRGRLVRRLLVQGRTAVWDGLDKSRNDIKAGIYIVQIKAKEKTELLKFLWY